eukprot:4535673-Amphidinium_carterae.1
MEPSSGKSGVMMDWSSGNSGVMMDWGAACLQGGVPQMMDWVAALAMPLLLAFAPVFWGGGCSRSAAPSL